MSDTAYSVYVSRGVYHPQFPFINVRFELCFLILGIVLYKQQNELQNDRLPRNDTLLHSFVLHASKKLINDGNYDVLIEMFCFSRDIPITVRPQNSMISWFEERYSITDEVAGIFLS